ncbi:apolipophorins-like [Mytilus trossulus]|uniref:apolipophorins-like n=1 Tax=Mytilus trossulus TaxID=6551 RepID=UPI0030040B10
MGLKLLILCALVVLNQAAKLPKSQTATCSRQCTESKKFGYETGKTYDYDYTSKVSTTIQGASEDKAGIDMAAKVHIEVQSKCDLVLKVSDVVLTESDPKSPNTRRNADVTGEFKKSLEQNPLMFSFQDGRVDELCPSNDEQTWALNIKRAIISAFQNSMDDFSQEQKTKEMDVTGSCDVNYSLASNGWYTMTIKKTKDTLGCVDRHGYKTAMQGTPYRVPSEIQSMPLVKSTHECQQGISKTGILQSSSCEEQHVLRPFSRESRGAVTETKQTLKYITESQSRSTKVSTEKRTTLAFEHAFDNSNSANAQKEVLNKLTEFCELSKDAVKVSTAKQFTELVRLMKTLDSDSMESVHKKVHSGKVCPKNTKVRKFFLDAIPMVGTKASLKMMTHLINTDEVTGAEADMWMTSLSFIQHPTKDMLLELKPLLTNTKNGQAMLAVSSLVYTYCKTSSCANDIDMVNLVASLEDKIGVGCYADKNNVNNIIRALRAFGNAGFSSSITMVNSCLTRKENPTEVRLAAAQAFRRMACDANRNELMTIYLNRDEDSEIRIAAYLGLMTCPSKSILNRIQTTLESEEVNQVGSFVWTHLTNLMETSSPLKQSIKSILSNDILKKEFNLEKMKYSRNYEASFFLEKMNTGAAIDSNLIWSSKSFLPRSAMTNLTVDLFGHSVNLFEFGGRVEGLEYFLESYFGPEGYFGKSKDVVKQSVKGISNKAMDKLNEEFGSTMEEFKGSMYLRIFGNELQYINTDDIKSLIEGQNFNILDFIINLAKEQDYSFTQSFMFLDTSIIIPTMSGFPLNISLDGSATIDVQASGKMDLRQIQSNPMTVSIDGKIRPSAALEVTSLMSVDAFVTKAGMKMVSSVNSASAVEGHLEIKGGQLFSAEWKTPDAKTEIFEAKTSFFTVHRDETREQKMVTQNRQTKKLCTGDDIAHVTGLELCGEISYPNASLKADSPYFPLTGPLTAGVTLYKRDSHTGYKMEYKFGKTKSLVIANVGFNTPGSKVDREMRLGFNLNMKKHDIEMMMLSPWKKATFNGAVDTKQRQLNGKLLIDQSEYSVNAALASQKKSSKMIYTPSVEIVIPKKDNIKLDGTIEYLAGTTLDSAFTIRGVSKEPINMRLNMLNKKVIKSIKGSFTMDKKEEYSFETRMQTLVTKQSLRYSPFISVKTPAKLLMGLGGSVEMKYKKAAKVDLTVTGLTRSPMKYFG